MAGTLPNDWMLPYANTARYLRYINQLESPMYEYGFAIHMLGLDFEDEATLLVLDDEEITVVPSTSDGLLTLYVILAADSPMEAWREFTAFCEQRAPRISITRVDLDLVSISQIAERSGVARETARLWSRGLRREGFPAPFTSAGQSLLWAWSDVFCWLSSSAELDEPVPLPVAAMERINGDLAERRVQRTAA